MSDQKLRDLERKWRETGASQDEAALLIERVRVGDLTPGDLKRAAYCGHPVASILTNVPTPREENLGRWVTAEGIEAPWWNRRCMVLAAVTACSLVAAPSGHENRFAEAISSAEKWVACPCATHAAEAGRVGEALEDLRNGPNPALAAAAECATACASSAPAMCVQSALWCIVEALSRVNVPYGRQSPEEREAWLASESVVRRGVENALARQALSTGLEESD